MSYFPCDIPFMSDEELKENGINIPKNVSDTNVGNTDDYIRRQDAIDKINERQRKLIYCFGFENDAVKIMDIAKSIIIALPAADVVPVVHKNYPYCHCGAKTRGEQE